MFTNHVIYISLNTTQTKPYIQPKQRRSFVSDLAFEIKTSISAIRILPYKQLRPITTDPRTRTVGLPERRRDVTSCHISASPAKRRKSCSINMTTFPIGAAGGTCFTMPIWVFMQWVAFISGSSGFLSSEMVIRVGKDVMIDARAGQ